MKCEWVQENILLYIYSELADDARYELEQHLGRCPECAAELKSARAFHAIVVEASGCGADSEPAGRFAHATAGSARDGAAGWMVAATYVRSGQLAAAGTLLSRTGGGDFHGWVWRRDWGDVQDDAH